MKTLAELTEREILALASLKLFALPVENDELAAGKVEVYAMQPEQSLLLPLSDEGEGSQIRK